jgi:hypothetical protein
MGNKSRKDKNKKVVKEKKNKYIESGKFNPDTKKDKKSK